MIFDCHTHWSTIWNTPEGGGVSGWNSVFLKYNIQSAFVMPVQGLMSTESIHSDNEAICSLAGISKEVTVYPLVTTNPNKGIGYLEELEYWVDTKNAAGFKFHPWLQGFSLNHPGFSAICELATVKRVPIIFHDGTPPFSLPEQVISLAERFPRTLFVSGHSGLLWNWKTLLHGAALPNLMITLCGVHGHALETLAKAYDSGNILWGSDFGFGLSDSIGYRFRLLETASISDTLRQRILEQNPLRLIAGEV